MDSLTIPSLAELDARISQTELELVSLRKLRRLARAAERLRLVEAAQAVKQAERPLEAAPCR